MHKIKIVNLEKILNIKIKRNYTSIGFDWATRAGISFIKTTDKYATIEYIFIEFKGNKPKEKYGLMVKSLKDLLNSQDIAIIENVFVGFNRSGSMELAKYHAFAISECIRKNINYETISAVSCRAKLGINTKKFGKGKSKLAVSDWLKNNLNIKLDDEDASDAVCLAICGLLEGLDFRSEKDIKKDKKK